MKQIITILFVLELFNAYAQDTTSIYPVNKKLYTAQMHIHGLSNHNASTKPGSLQWHSRFADSTGADIIWWTEHRDIYKQNVAYKFNFTNGIFDSINNDIIGLAGDQTDPIKWEGDKNGGVLQMSVTTDTLNIKFTDIDDSDTLIYASFIPTGTKGTLKSFREFIRPLLSQPIATFELTKDGILDADHNKLTFEVILSFHYYDDQIQQKLIYNFVDEPATFSYDLIDSSNLVINYPVHAGSNDIQLDIETDAMLLKDGGDNSMQNIIITLMTKNNDSLFTKFSNFKMRSLHPQNLYSYTRALDYLNNYKSRYKLQEIMGTEISSYGDAATHINGFLPDSADQSVMYVDSNGYNTSDQFISGVHQRGGITSLNHPFGTSFTVDFDTQEYRTDTMSQFLLNNDAFGADIIEVGYLKRGDVDLFNHLRMWDILTANRLYLYGNGVGDMHGGDWFGINQNWVSHIWATDSSATSLIETLKQGRFFFGDLRLFKDKFYFCVGGACMGDRTVPDYAEAPLVINIDNAPANALFKLTQGLIQPGLVVTYLYKDSVVDLQNLPCLNISQPNFIRIGMYVGNVPYFISNPIVFHDSTSNPDASLCTTNIAQEKYEDLVNYKLYPSPSSRDINLTFNLTENRNVKISILDNAGKYIRFLGKYEFKTGANSKTFPNLKLSSGNYLLLLEYENYNKTLPFIFSN